MARTAELRMRVDLDAKEEAAIIYKRWGLSLADAVNMFLHETVHVGGLPFELKPKHKFNWDSPDLVKPDPATGAIVLPAEMDWPEDEGLYDEYAA